MPRCSSTESLGGASGVWAVSRLLSVSGKTTLLRAMVDLGRIVSSPTNPVTLLRFLSNQTMCEPTRFSLEGEGLRVPDCT